MSEFAYNKFIQNFIALPIFDIYARTRRLEFLFALSPMDIKSALYIRWTVYSEEGHIRPDDYPNRLFSDDYDKVSITILAKHCGNAVGTLRLTPFIRSIPTFDLFNVCVPDYVAKHALFELGRFAVDKHYRTQERGVSLGLLRTAYGWSLKHNMRWLAGYAPEKLLEAYYYLFDQIEILKEEPLQKHNIKARKSMAGYFAKYECDARPFVIDVSSISTMRGLRLLKKQLAGPTARINLDKTKP